MSAFNHIRIVGTFDANGDLFPRERAEFDRLGVSEVALDTPVPVRAGHVVYGDDGRFDFEQHLRLSLAVRTVRAFLFLVEDIHFELEDIITWSPAIGRLATWRGSAWGLGQERALAPRMDKRDALPVHRSPLEWLKAGRRGTSYFARGSRPIFCVMRDLSWPRTRRTASNCERRSPGCLRASLSRTSPGGPHELHRHERRRTCWSRRCRGLGYA